MNSLHCHEISLFFFLFFFFFVALTLPTFVQENEFVLIEFYAPWCGLCKLLAPEYAKAATTLANLEKPVLIAKVDGDENPQAPSKFGVRGYPTITLFINGQGSKYSGRRTESEIVSWVSKKVSPAQELAALSDVESFKSSSDVVAVGFFSKSSDELKAFESTARVRENVPFGVVEDATVAAEFGVSAPAVILFKNFDDGKTVYSGEYDVESIQEFIQGNSVPLVSTFTQENAAKIFGSGIDNHFLYFSHKSAENHESVVDQLRVVAQEFRGKIRFTYVPSTTESNAMSYFDLTADHLPAVLVSLGSGGMKKFCFSKELTAANIREHVNDFHNGKLKPTLKSEEIPKDNNGLVIVVVGKNFNDIVLDTSKNVLLEFYAPWCDYCKSLAPTYEQLGAMFADQSSIVIAKVDATANEIDHPAVSVHGFPTILFFPADRKDTPLTYEGDRDLKSLIGFVASHATTLSSKRKAVNGELSVFSILHVSLQFWGLLCDYLYLFCKQE
jgi:protein disulfide-isomerase A1